MRAHGKPIHDRRDGRERGASAVEYCLMAVLIGVALAGALAALGMGASEVVQAVVDLIRALVGA